jgi:hypothetical protein
MRAAPKIADAQRDEESCPHDGKMRQKGVPTASLPREVRLSTAPSRHPQHRAGKKDEGNRSKSRDNVSNHQAREPKQGKAFPKE